MSGRRVLLIGYGAIGQAIMAHLQAVSGYRLAVLRRNIGHEVLPKGVETLHDLEDVDEFAPDLIVEAAGQAVVRDLVSAWLQDGIDVLISSVGALHDAGLRERLETAARNGCAALLIPAGALAGVDYVNAVGAVPGTRIRYESRKPLAAWQQEIERLGFQDEAATKPVTLYHGDAAGAAARYPANLNVAATLAMAAGGFDRVDVTVIADGRATGNTHTIAVAGPVGTMEVRVVNAPAPDNPKTSMLVAHSVARAIMNHFSPIRMV